MHPHWQTDGEQDVPVRARDVATGKRVSRAPAAIIGIAIMLGGAAFTFGGLNALMGQLTAPTPDVTIRLTPTGPDPDPAEVAPGQVIRFVNEDQIPHVLTSNDLPTSDGEDFITPGIFGGNDHFYAVPANAPEGTYTYISQTNPDFSGTIEISASAASSASSVAVSSAASSVASIPTSSAPSSSAAPLPLPTSSSRPASSAPLTAGVIAVNPHVVGARGNSASSKPVVTQHKPTGHTESGPETWLIIGCAIIAVALAARGAFRRV